MKPPLASQPPTGSLAQQYLHRARMFRTAAMGLADYSNGEQFLPKYALLTHAIELSLKAFVLQAEAAGKPSPATRPRNHDLRGWYDLALKDGLQDDPSVSAHIAEMNDLHFTHYTRYPPAQPLPVPDLSIMADATVDHLIAVVTRSVNPH